MCQLYDPGYSGITSVRLGTSNSDGGKQGVKQLSDQDESPCTASVLLSPHFTPILSLLQLNEFNPMGDTLASTMGYHILIWSPEEDGSLKDHERL